MSYEPLTLRYRPRFWRDLMGQEVVVQTLTNMLKDGRIIPSLIFGGSRGCGKTTAARILAKSLNCAQINKETYEPCGECDICRDITAERHMSVQECDAASNGNVDDIRRIKEETRYADSGSGYRVYIIDEAHSLSDKAWQAFLKLLEEPPPNTVFVFCTTETHKIPETIVSRSANFSFVRHSNEGLVRRLQDISLKENIQADPGVFPTIARHVNGGMRDAISLLDQLTSYAGGKQITLDHVAYVVGSVNTDLLFKLFDALLHADMKLTYTLLHQAYSEISDVPSLVTELALFYRDLMMIKADVPLSDAQPDYLARCTECVTTTPLEYLLSCQTELAYISSQLSRSKLPTRSVLDIYIPKLFYGGMRVTSAAPQLSVTAPICKSADLSADEVAAIFGASLLNI